MRKLIVTAVGVWVLSSCTEEAAKTPAVPTPVAPTKVEPAPTPAPKIEEIPITSSSPEAVEAFKRARANAELGAVPEAVVDFERAVKLDPKFALALAYLGFFTATEEGTAMLARAVTLSEKLPPPERLLVDLLRAWRQGDSETLRAQRKRLKDLAPTDWRVHLLAAMGAQEDRLWLEAAAACTEAIRLNPQAVPAYNLLGYALMNQGKFDEAIATLTTSTQKGPAEATSFDALAEAQLRAGQFEAAEQNFTKAIALSPKFWAAQVGIAQSRFLRGNWAGGREALASAQKAAEQPADQAEAATFVVWSYLAEGNSGEAIKAAEAMEKAAKQAHQGLPYATAPILKAIAYTDSAQFGAALSQVPIAMERVRKAGVEGDGLAKLYRTTLLWKMIAEVREGSIKEAEKTFSVLTKTVSVAISSESTSTRCHAQGILSLAHGDKQIALQQLLECNEDDFLCRTELATVQDAMGDAEAAKATRKQLVSANRREAPYLYARAIALGLKPTATKSAPKKK